MKWFVWISVIFITAGLGYYYYDNASKPKPPVTHEIHDGKATLRSKTRDHEALWIHYDWKDMNGKSHEISEKIPYIDLWERLQVGDTLDILYDDEGVSTLKIVAAKRTQTDQPDRTGE